MTVSSVSQPVSQSSKENQYTMSKALDSIKARNSKAASEAELAALADALEAGEDVVLDEEEVLNTEYDGLGDDTTSIQFEEMEQHQEVETFEQSPREGVETPYANIVKEFMSTVPMANSVVTQQQCVPAFVNTNPQPVRAGMAPSIDRSARITPKPRKGSNNRTQVGTFDFVIFSPSNRNAADTVLVNALLDRLNPDFVIHGGANGADAMARTWCHSRDVEQVELIPNWGDGASTNNVGLGTAAGPIRNNLMLDLADELQEVHGKRGCVVTFTLKDQYDRDQITASMVRAVEQRNAIKNEDVADRQYILPIFEASAWLNDDFRASLPISTRGKVLEYDQPLIRS
jgi:hypothetical protein